MPGEDVSHDGGEGGGGDEVLGGVVEGYEGAEGGGGEAATGEGGGGEGFGEELEGGAHDSGGRCGMLV